MLNWVDEHVQPAGSILAQRPAPRPTARPADDAPATVSAPRPGEEIPTIAAPDPVGGKAGHEPSAMTAVPVQGNAVTGGARAVEADGPTADPDLQGVMPMGDNGQSQAIGPR